MTKDSILLKHQERMEELEIRKVKELATIESKKFEDIINAIGTNTLIEMAAAGPEVQAKLLKSLGL